MAGPAKVNVGTVINPFTEAQNALRDVVDTRTQAKKESRERQIFQEESDERDLARHNRELLKSYDPQLGVKGKGLSGDALSEYNTRVSQEVAKYQGMADKGEEVPTPEEMVKRFNTIGKSLVTREDARKAISNDLIRKGIAPEKSTAYAELYTSDLTSREELKSYETASVAAQNTAYEAQQDAAEKAIKANTDRFNSNRLTAAEYKAGNFRGYGSTSTKGSSGDGWSLDNMAATTAYLDEAIGTSDSARTVAAMNNAMLATNTERRKLGMKPINYKDVQMLVAAKKGASDSWFNNSSGYEGEKGAAILQEDLTTLFKSDYEAEKNRRSVGGYTSVRGGVRPTQPINETLMRAMLNTQRAAPRSMSTIERERVAKAFGYESKAESVPPTPSTRGRDVLPTPPSVDAPKEGVESTTSKPAKMSVEEAQQLINSLRKPAGSTTSEASAVRGTVDAVPPPAEVPLRTQAVTELAQAVFDADQAVKASTYRLQSIGRTVPAGSEEAAEIRQQHSAATQNKELADAQAEKGRKAYGMDGFWSRGEYNRIAKGIEDADNKRRVAAKFAEGATRRKVNQDNRYYREGEGRLSALSDTLKGTPSDRVREYSETEIRSLAAKMSDILRRRESGY